MEKTKILKYVWKNNCLDNAVMGNFFTILKQEFYYGRTYNSYLELKQTIDKYIKHYNKDRIKHKLRFNSTVQDKNNLITKQK
ncbi:IS3 family transposase [Mycoplasma bradburyae]|uniref:IS3 family transposase n=1 Tax=Mycoplasma bradburyae TaxID=2963128 RepID=UPI0034E028AA